MVFDPVNTISIIIITRNEVKSIEELLDEINSQVKGLLEIIVVDDSTDKTPDVVIKQCDRYPNIRLVLQKEKGYTNAIRMGIKNAKGDAVVVVTGDLSDEIKDVNKMKDKMGEGYDIVCASRYMRGAKKIGSGFFQDCLSYMAGKSLSLLLKIPTCDVTNSFKMYRKRIFDYIEVKDSGFAISMQITLKSFFEGYKIVEIPTAWKWRVSDESKFIFRNQLGHYVYWYFWALFKWLVIRVG